MIVPQFAQSPIRLRDSGNMVARLLKRFCQKSFIRNTALALELLHRLSPLAGSPFDILAKKLTLDCNHVHALTSLRNIEAFRIAINPLSFILDFIPHGYNIIPCAFITLYVFDKDYAWTEALRVTEKSTERITRFTLVAQFHLVAVQTGQILANESSNDDVKARRDDLFGSIGCSRCSGVFGYEFSNVPEQRPRSKVSLDVALLDALDLSREMMLVLKRG